jgi:hypothetical protein
MGGTKCLRLGTCELEDMGGVLQNRRDAGGNGRLRDCRIGGGGLGGSGVGGGARARRRRACSEAAVSEAAAVMAVAAHTRSADGGSAARRP